MKYYLVALISILSLPIFSQNVGIGTETPDASAALDISDTNKGLLIPRVDTSAITDPAIGLLVYQLSDNGFYSFNGVKWTLIGKVDGRIEDQDGDTRIEVEQNPDEDKIRFFTDGTEVMRQNGSTLETPNSGHSVFVGEEAGLNDDLTDNNNVFVGYRAGKENISGLNNIAIGEQALQNSTMGNNNVAIGKQAMSLSTGSNNVGIGLNSLQKNSTGGKNTAVGGFSGFANQTGSQNTLIGYEAGRGTANDISGGVMIGHQAGKNETASNKLYIANSDTDSPLIYGDFANNTLMVNDSLAVAQQISVGNPTGTQQESAELAGAIQIGNAASDNPASNDAGTIRWNESDSDYQGWDGSEWLSLTSTNEEIDCEIGIEIDTLPYVIVEPGFYYLTKNLTLDVSGSHGITVNSSDVTIDLNGYSLTGPGNFEQSDDAGIFWDGSSNVSVRNGTIKRWKLAGIYGSGSFGAGTRSSANNIIFQSNGIGLRLLSFSFVKNCVSTSNLNEGFSIGSFSTLESCISQGNTGDGFSIGRDGVILNCISRICNSNEFNFTSGCKFTNCIAEGFGDGSGFKGLDNNTFTNCSANDRSFNGFDVSSNNIFKNCLAEGSQLNGYKFDNGCSFIDCIAEGNSEVGFTGNDGNILSNCISKSNRLNGITCLDNNSIKDCNITENERSGIDVRHFNRIEANVISFNNTDETTVESGLDINIGNKVIGNSITDNFHIGVTINSHRNLLDGNDVVNTRTSSGIPGIGFNFLSTNNAWRNNTAVGNTGSNVSAIEPPISRSLNNWMY